MTDHFTKESEGKIGSVTTVEDARKAHHLASADPEPERDGLMTGPAHEEKYGLERAPDSAAIWRGAGVHPTENRALVDDEEGAENLRGAAGNTSPPAETETPPPTPAISTATAPAAPETVAAPRASDPVS